MELLAKKKGGKSLVVQNLQRVGVTEDARDRDARMAADAVVTPEDSQKKEDEEVSGFSGTPCHPLSPFHY